MRSLGSALFNIRAKTLLLDRTGLGVLCPGNKIIPEMTRNGLYFKCRITSIIIDNQYTAVLSVHFNNIEKVKYLFMHYVIILYTLNIDFQKATMF